MKQKLEQVTRGRLLAENGAGRAMREAARLSVREVAQGIGVSAATVSRWENGVCMPRAEAAARWFRALEALGAVGAERAR